jgi:hypothetical protein
MPRHVPKIYTSPNTNNSNILWVVLESNIESDHGKRENSNSGSSGSVDDDDSGEDNVITNDNTNSNEGDTQSITFLSLIVSSILSIERSQSTITKALLKKKFPKILKHIMYQSAE